MDEHPAKVELRRFLQRLMRPLELTLHAVDDLVRKARIASWNENQFLSLSGDTDGFVNLLMTGVARVEIVRRDARQCAGKVGILEFVAPGEIFYLSPTPRDGRYHLRVVAHRSPQTHGRAMVAMWGRQAITDVLASLPGTGLNRMLEAARLGASRLAEDQHVMLSFRLRDRLLYALRRLAPRFGLPGPDGVLIDLYLADDVVARVVEASRPRVNRAINALCRAGVMRRERPRIVLLAARAEAAGAP